MRVLAFGIGLTSLTAMVLSVQGRSSGSVELANRFLDSLSDAQRSHALKAFDDDYRTNWRYVPANRDGIHLGELTAGQAELGLALVKSSLSSAGMKRVETIRTLEDVLKELEGGNIGRNKGLYTFTFFGKPSASDRWGWRYEGHHVSLNFTYRGKNLISSSPQFFGANPAEVRSGPMKGTRVLAPEQDLAFSLLDSLSEAQLHSAVLEGGPPADIVTGNARKVGILKDAGLHYRDMTAAQKSLVSKLLHVYCDAQAAEEAKRRWKSVDLDSVVFAWMGSTKPGKGHYYRLQGAKFLVEYDNTQNDANHIHSVWRDFDGDFGEDVLAEHYAMFH